MASFSYSTDNLHFTLAGQAYPISKGGWVGAQMGLFSVGNRAATQPSHLDVDYFRVRAE